MARSPKAAEYERVSRLRKTYDVQANMLGWSKLDLLAAYLTDDDQLVAFTKDEHRISGEAIPLPAEIEAARTVPVVEPLAITPEEFAERWQAGREKIGAQIAKLDLSTIKHADALKLFTELTALSARASEILQSNDGPDWRETLKIEG